MQRSEFTPCTWHNENKTLTFRMDSHGITDISPGPNSGLAKWVELNYGKPLLSLINSGKLKM